MQLTLIAALLIAPPAATDGFCAALRRAVDTAPDGFAGAPLQLDNPLVAGNPFSCTVGQPEDDRDPVKAAHLDFACETGPMPSDEASLTRDMAAIDAKIDGCDLPYAMRIASNGPVTTPYTVIEVKSWISPDASAIRLTVHQLRKR
jgi:hypothetical protein